MDGCPRSIIGLEFVAECFHDRFAYHVETAMVLECGKEDQWPVIFESRNLVTNGFLGFRRGSLDCLTKLLERDTCLFWKTAR